MEGLSHIFLRYCGPASEQPDAPRSGPDADDRSSVGAVRRRELRRSFAPAASRSPPHSVRAFAGGARPVLGQVRVENRSNGIAAVPALLGMPAPGGRVVTADVMHAQRRTAREATATTTYRH